LPNAFAKRFRESTRRGPGGNPTRLQQQYPPTVQPVRIEHRKWDACGFASARRGLEHDRAAVRKRGEEIVECLIDWEVRIDWNVAPSSDAGNLTR
jgi:hypothetical protein